MVRARLRLVRVRATLVRVQAMATVRFALMVMAKVEVKGRYDEVYLELLVLPLQAAH